MQFVLTKMFDVRDCLIGPS